MKIEKILVDKALLNVSEIMNYTGLGENTVRELLRSRNCPFSVKIKSRYYANKKALDKWIDLQTGVR